MFQSMQDTRDDAVGQEADYADIGAKRSKKVKGDVCVQSRVQKYMAVATASQAICCI